MSSRRASQGAAVVAAAALGVAVAVVGVSALGDDGPDPAPRAGLPTTEPTVLGEDVLLLDRGAVGFREAVGTCSSKRYADGEAVEVLYAVRQLTPDDEQPVVVLRNGAGELRLCDADGPDAPGVSPLPAVSPRKPVAILGSGSSWSCTGTTLDRFVSDSWLLVGGTVATVRARLVVDGEAGPWFTTTAQRGFAHLHVWQDGPLDEGTDLAVEHEALDAAGTTLPSGELPAGPAPVGWCEDGDVQIG